MKTGFLKISTQLMLIFLFIGTLNSVHAQERMKKEMQKAHMKEAMCEKSDKACCGIPDLTDEQRKKMKKLKLKLMKETLPVKNALREKKARMNTLTTADNPDMNEINKVIDEITSLKGDMMKKTVALKMEIRKLLTEEQRIMFDSHSQKHGKTSHAGKGYQGHF